MAKSKGGNRKGNPFAWEVCKALSLWWSKGDRDDIFYKTTSSGARATSRAKKGQSTSNSHGDIAALDTEGLPFLKMFTVEVKRGYSKHTFQDLLDSGKGAAKQVYDQWIEQAVRSARDAGSFTWMIVLRRDRRESLVMLPELWFDRIKKVEPRSKSGSYAIIVSQERGRLCVLTFQGFLNLAGPRMIQEQLNRWKGMILDDS